MADSIESGKAQRPEARGDPRLDWWREARFGAFIHWGLYALPDPWADRPTIHETNNPDSGEGVHWTQEWVQYVRRIRVSEYEQLAAQFNPTNFDAGAWADLVLEAGQKYVILTSKHHDGFCLFRTSHTSFNVVEATPCKRDIVGELAEACYQRGLKFGLYYSQTQDWHHPDGHGNNWDFDPEQKDFDRYIEEYVHAQIRELLTQYGPIAVLWFDTPQILRAEQSQGLLDLVHELQPDCLVNGRVGHGLGDYATTRDNQYLTGAVAMDWECPATMNDTWGYRASDQNWKSSDDMLANLRDVVAKNGNYLLNVGPDERGRIPEPSVERLRAMGAWLQAHPETLSPRPNT